VPKIAQEVKSLFVSRPLIDSTYYLQVMHKFSQVRQVEGHWDTSKFWIGR